MQLQDSIVQHFGAFTAGTILVTNDSGEPQFYLGVAVWSQSTPPSGTDAAQRFLAQRNCGPRFTVHNLHPAVEWQEPVREMVEV